MVMVNMTRPTLYLAWIEYFQRTKPYLQDHDIKVRAFRNAEDNIPVPKY